jgi:cytoskeletal protein RodZ
VTIGDTLAAGRRQAGMTVTQVSQRTCIRETIIRSIERGDFSSCGGDFYARGHIRSIAGAVGISPEPLIEEYDATMGAPRAISAADVFSPVTPVRLKERRRPNWTAALAVAVVVAGGIGAYLYFGHSPAPKSDAQTVQTANTHHHKQTVNATPPAHHKQRLEIKIVASQDCWVTMTSLSTGKTLFDATIPAGETKRWSERHGVKLAIGNPSGVVLTVNGKRQIRPGVVSPVSLSLELHQAAKKAHGSS